jgi:hypothetical protein
VGEDEYIFFLLSYFAQSYRGIANQLYRYNFGDGISVAGAQIISKKRFFGMNTLAEAYAAMRRFLQQQERTDPEWLTVLDEMCTKKMGDTAWQWMHCVSTEEACATYDDMICSWGVVPIVSALARLFWNKEDEVVRRIAPAGCPRKIPVKHLAVYAGEADGSANGIGQLLPLFAEMGYRVTLVTDDTPGAPADHEKALPAGVERVVLPSAAVSQGEGYAKRAEAWQALVERREIDTVLYCAWRTPLFFWDACVLKGLGCALVVQAREAFSAAFAENYLRGAATVNAVRLADAAAVPAAFVEFWRNLCPAYGVEPPENDDSAACKAAWQKLFDDVGSGAAVMPQEPTAEQRMVELWLEDLQRGASGYSEQTERLLNSKFHTMARVYWKCKDKGLAAVRKLKHKLRR